MGAILHIPIIFRRRDGFPFFERDTANPCVNTNRLLVANFIIGLCWHYFLKFNCLLNNFTLSRGLSEYKSIFSASNYSCRQFLLPLRKIRREKELHFSPKIAAFRSNITIFPFSLFLFQCFFSRD